MNPNDSAYQSGQMLGALLVGAICGTIPLALGRKRDRTAIGWLGFALCVVAGFFLKYIGALPMAGLMSLIILAIGPPARKLMRSGSDFAPRTAPPQPYEL